MKYEKLNISSADFIYLKDLLDKIDPRDAVHKAGYDKLRVELESAVVKPAEELPSDVVRINSLKGYQLVKPENSNPAKKKISILTPMGLALIGYAAGDEVIWSFPSGEQKIIIKNVYQEEKSSVE